MNVQIGSTGVTEKPGIARDGNVGKGSDDAPWSDFTLADNVHEILKSAVEAMNLALARGIATEFSIPLTTQGHYVLQGVKFLKRIEAQLDGHNSKNY